MSVFQIMSFIIIIIISSVFLHTHSADGNTYSAVMPQTVTALTGSCVQIPCTFNISSFEDKRNQAKSIYGIWVKKKPQFADKDSFIAFNSSKNIIKGFSDIQMTGNLSERNCTTVFYNIMMNHSDFYYFRLEMEPNVFRATFNDSSKTVRITVKDSPQPPELKPTDLKPVMENTTVSLSCSAEAPCPKQPPTISWSYIPESAHITTQLQEKPDKTQSVFSHMTFKASYMDHKKNISCTATYPRKSSKDSTVETTVMLRVLFSPKETRITIDPSASVSVNTSVTLTCKSKGSPSREMNYTWYKRGQEMAIAQGKQITFNGTQNNAGWYSCTAQNEHGKQSSAEIQLTVEGQDGHFMPLIVGCVGGIVAVLTLSALGFCARTRTNRGDIVGDKDSLHQAQDKTIYRNSTYDDVHNVTTQDNTISDDYSVCERKTDHDTGKDQTEEDDHEEADGNTYSAVMPQTVTALTGSCVQIPCTFTISSFEDKRNKAKSINGIWLKNKSQFADEDSLIAFNSSKTIRGFSDIQMTGNLSERNCTTVFYNIMMNHSDLYFFRLEMEPNVFRATFKDSSKTVRITVKETPLSNMTMHCMYSLMMSTIISLDSPQPPELKPTDLKPVMENTTVNLSCSAEAPCPKQPPTISWSYIPESAHITPQLQEKPDKTQSVFSHMTFKASYMDHRKNISCTATYPRKSSKDSTVETTVMLRVLFPPKETRITIDPSASVSVNTNVTLTCKSKASPSREMNYTWYKRGQEMAIAWAKKISFIVTHNNTGSYFCIAQNNHGKQSSAEIQLTVEEESAFSQRVIYGCTGGLLAFVLLSAVFFYCMRIKTSSQAHVIGRDQATDKNSDMVAIYANSSIPISKKSEKKETDDLHYGEIDFSKLQTGDVTREHSNNGPQTEYAEIQVTGRNNKNQKC
ncbi:B-cell receptor CD22-like [Rhinichthys klamathensis goyatoka]|uniref:B-cell receptor CD22-like n=1 Tax=Rhinichthys klamathensis goyatoka TaxID=3034132 RepID=UPI0024B49E11|nr:B-cell receptor CD22-like [Rhinichthys klamathensis goyatoka]